MSALTPMNLHVSRALSAFAIAGTLGAGAWVGMAAGHAAPQGVDAYAFEVGDDNGDGRIDEDESGWDCTSMGNHVCGPLASGPSAWDGSDYVGGFN